MGCHFIVKSSPHPGGKRPIGYAIECIEKNRSAMIETEKKGPKCASFLMSSVGVEVMLVLYLLEKPNCDLEQVELIV